MNSVQEVKLFGERLLHRESQYQNVVKLLEIYSSGHDISAAIPYIIRYILTPSKSTSISNDLLSLSVDAVISSPNHSYYPQILDSFHTLMQSTNPEHLRIVLSRSTSLPFSATRTFLSQHSSLIISLANHPHPYLRRAAYRFALSCINRDRALTFPAPSSDPSSLSLSSHLQQNESQIRVILEKIVLMICEGTLDEDDGVSVGCLRGIIKISIGSRGTAPLKSTKDALATSIWDLLLANIIPIGKRMDQLESAHIEYKRDAQRSLALLSAVALSGASLNVEKVTVGDKNLNFENNSALNNVTDHSELMKLKKWAVEWIERRLLVNISKHEEILFSKESTDSHTIETVRSFILNCYNLLHICGKLCLDEEYSKFKLKWTQKAIASLVKVLSTFCADSEQLDTEKVHNSVQLDIPKSSSNFFTKNFHLKKAHDPSTGSDSSVMMMSHDEVSTVLRVLIWSLQKLAFWKGSGTYIIRITSQLIPYACSRLDNHERFCAQRQLSELLVCAELGVKPFETAVTGAVQRVVISSGFSRLLKHSDPNAGCELMCALYQSCLHSAVYVRASNSILLADHWASMIAKLLARTARVLTLTECSALPYARENYLKLFEALGQYNDHSGESQNASAFGLEYEQVQQLLIQMGLIHSDGNVRSALLSSSTRYWIESGLKAEANAAHVLKAMWRHLIRDFRDEKRALSRARNGVLWIQSIDEEDSKYYNWSTLQTDYVSVVCSTSVELVRRIPHIAEQMIALFRKYLRIFKAARVDDELAFDLIQSTLNAIAIFKDKYHPKAVSRRLLTVMAARLNQQETENAMEWLSSVSEACVYATSRGSFSALSYENHREKRDFPEKNRELSLLVHTEENVLRAADSSGSLAGESVDAYRVRLEETVEQIESKKQRNISWDDDTLWHSEQTRESEPQTLSTASDPLHISANHSVFLQRGIIRMTLSITNRTNVDSDLLYLSHSCSGGLTPLYDRPTQLSIGILPSGQSINVSISFSCISSSLSKSFTSGGIVYLKLSTQLHSSGEHNTLRVVEQPGIPYFIPSFDILLLRKPPKSAGLDVFRRRWDLMKSTSQFYVYLNESQNLDVLVDVIQRKSPLHQVGKFRQFSHFSALMADSKFGDYVAVGVYAGEAESVEGFGPCMVTIQIRTDSDSFCELFANECQDWLTTYQFRIVYLEDVKVPPQKLKVYPRDQYYIKSGQNSNIHQRWRAAQYARMSY